MTDQMSGNEPKGRTDMPEEMRETGSAGRGRRGQSGAWIGGAVLIVLGVVFLFQNLGANSTFLNNWWALFILIPAISAFERAMRNYRDAGNRITRTVSGALVSGSILLLITFVFLFNLDLSLLGPAILILIGLSMLANSMWAKRN